MSCKPGFFNGWGDCIAMLENMVGCALQYKGNTWTDATSISGAAWQTAIADDDFADRDTLAILINAFIPTTDEPEITSSLLGKKYLTKNAIPSGTIMIDASLCDYKQLHVLTKRSYEFIPFFDDKSYWLTRKSDNTLKGFRCRIATVAGFKPDDATTSYPMHIFFDSYNEFKEVVIVSPTFSFDDIHNYSPAGIDVRILTPYTGGVVVVVATQRGSGAVMTGLDQVTDWETMASSFGTTLPVAVTIVAEVDSSGQYTLTVKKDTGGTPANLDATDLITFQAHQDDAANLTFLSHQFNVVGGS